MLSGLNIKRITLMVVAAFLLCSCQGGEVKVKKVNVWHVQNGQGHSAEGATGSKFVPPEGKTLMIIGQDSDTIRDYIDQVP